MAPCTPDCTVNGPPKLATNYASIRVRGTVQGVGFRPYVWKVATGLGLKGNVRNDSEGVLIQVWGKPANIQALISQLHDNTLPLADVTGVEVISDNAPDSLPESFSIISSTTGQPLTSVSADAATCPDCLRETSDPENRRFGYPFTNCTHCGPRFSIINAIPYDRANTSMQAFTMCPACQHEYDDPADRRFHAQPNACPECGPTLWFTLSGDSSARCPRPAKSSVKSEEKNPAQAEDKNFNAIQRAAEVIEDGGIVAIKGIGGFHLACDATNHEAVERLRQRKVRYRKALAIMVRDVAMAEQYVECDQEQRRLLSSPAAPIVLLTKSELPQPETELPDNLAPGQNSLGVLLPYTPLHHLLMAKVQRPLVMTSGNRSDEPQCIDNADAISRLAAIADAFLLHDRPIINRIDDSVVNADGQVIRRARGLAPKPVPLPPGFMPTTSILATGADLKNTFCLLHQGQAILSQYIGDLHEVATQQDYQRQISLQMSLFGITPEKVVIDAHPDYHSSKAGQSLAAALHIPVEPVQHHHAHIAAVMGEHDLPLETPPVLGIALDGLGFGDKGAFWGGEFLLCNYRNSQRIGRFRPTAMPGGNAAMKEPWRNTFAQLLATGQWNHLNSAFRSESLMQYLNGKPLEVVQTMIDRGLNSPVSSSAGRLFDAVAAALGLCRDEQLHEGEAAMQLQTLAEQWLERNGLETNRLKKNALAVSPYPFALSYADTDKGAVDQALSEIDWRPLWPALLQDLADNKEPGEIACRFHFTLATAIDALVDKLRQNYDFSVIVFSGGVMQNQLLRSLLRESLNRHNVPLLFSKAFPSNDGGIAFGQALVATARQL